MRILGDAVAVVVGVCEPPLVPPHQRGVDLRQEVQIPGGLVDLPCGPGRHRRLGDRRVHGIRQVVNYPLIVDGVGQHPVGALMVDEDAKLVAGESEVDVAVGQRVKECVPLPHAHVADLGRDHRFAG